MRLPGIWLLAFLLLAASEVCIGVPPAQNVQQRSDRTKDVAPVIFPDDEEVAQHRTGNHKPVRLSGKDKISQFPFPTVELGLIVALDGAVLSATPQEGPPEAYSRAVTEALTWNYVPFEKDGAPGVASFADYVAILPPEDLPLTHQEFPSISKLAGLLMTLSRSGCFGDCSNYHIDIYGDGTVAFKGESFVLLSGEHHDRLSPEQVSELIEDYRKSDYFSLKDEYSYGITDEPTYTTSSKADQISKSVTDYVGVEAGMPQSVSDLEEAIDRIADTKKWVVGDAETVPSLKREGWDFKSAQAAAVLAQASEKGNGVVVRGLLAEGVGLSGKDEDGHSALTAAASSGDQATLEMLIKAGAAKNDEQMKTEALAEVAATGDMGRLRLLLEYGGDAKGMIRNADGSSTVLMKGTLSGVPEIVEAILAFRPDINARDDKGHTALWYLWQAPTDWYEKHHAKRAQVVHVLARAGANLNAEDDEGNAPLHTADADVAAALIEDGADVNIRNLQGETPLMTNFDVDVARLLVAAGADVHALDHNGKTALDHAEQDEHSSERARFLKSLVP